LRAQKQQAGVRLPSGKHKPAAKVRGAQRRSAKGHETSAPAKRSSQQQNEMVTLMEQLKAWVQPWDLPRQPEDLRPEHVPRALTMEEQLLTAARIQRDVHAGKRTLPCCVCACFVSVTDVAHESMLLTELPNLALLDASMEGTPKEPRHGITHIMHEGVKYCLSPDGVTSGDGLPVCVRVCKSCWHSLTKEKAEAPPRSLVRVDTGPWPADQHGMLPALTHVEELLLSSVTPMRRVVVMRPVAGSTAFGISKRELTGHVVVVPGTSVEKLNTLLLPRNLEDLPEFLTVRPGSKTWPARDARACVLWCRVVCV
jgi:hypothetical protein